ncbi:MAG: DUF6440 family protein [Firmicutes bacterium]|nr:DUF6440 family protein [Bacillota bacterium]
MSKERFTAFEGENAGWYKGMRIITDHETGVQYFFASWGPAGGMTVLVDKDGKPLVDPNWEK